MIFEGPAGLLSNKDNGTTSKAVIAQIYHKPARPYLAPPQVKDRGVSCRQDHCDAVEER